MKGYIVLGNGEQFSGNLHGWKEDIYGEAVFFTGMTGYQEVITNPSFKDQIVIFTYPLIGNYGINEEDNESLVPQASALIMSECSEKGFHYQSQSSLIQTCIDHKIPLLTDVDTRALVKRIRQEGDMGAVITTDPENVNFDVHVPVEERDLVAKVSVTNQETYGNGDTHVVLIDYGHKSSIVDVLLSKGCKVTVVPYNTDEKTIHALQPNGILLSNGPGNPKQLEPQLPAIRRLAERYPTLGICLGHQLIALAFGGHTKKLTFGHRGSNQPVQDVFSSRVYITSQNHSYAVIDQTIENTGFDVRYKNVNDGTVEGLHHRTLPITTVQFHPEDMDSEEVYMRFIEQMKAKGREKAYA